MNDLCKNLAAERYRRATELNETKNTISGYFYPEKASDFSCHFSNSNYTTENSLEKVGCSFGGRFFIRRKMAAYEETTGSAMFFYEHETDSNPPEIKDCFLTLLGRGEVQEKHAALRLCLSKVDLYGIYSFLERYLSGVRIDFNGPVTRENGDGQIEFYVENFGICMDAERPSLAELNQQ